jgi:two-component system phosphate regulon sensor histidine kinase PhoR
MELGADDYITKPFSSAELRSAITSRLERHQLASQQAEQQLEEVKKNLVRMVAHELRTPLVSISMASEIVSRQLSTLPPDRIRELLNYIDRGSERLYHLVEQMILVTQLKAGVLTRSGLADQGIEVLASTILISAIDLGRRFSTSHTETSVNTEWTHDAVLQADPHSFKHALAELIANAFNFSPDEKDVKISMNALTDHWIQIQIADHGPGIPPEKLSQAQQAFEQIDRQDQEQQGMGLGLYLARQIIDVHRGTLEIESAVGRGTRAVIKLPAKDVLGE